MDCNNLTIIISPKTTDQYVYVFNSCQSFLAAKVKSIQYPISVPGYQIQKINCVIALMLSHNAVTSVVNNFDLSVVAYHVHHCSDIYELQKYQIH